MPATDSRLLLTATLTSARDQVVVLSLGDKPSTMSPMKILSVVGARPQFVKLAPIAHAAERAGVAHKIVHTGQHYDPMLSEVFFNDLQIPAPDYHLGVGSGSHATQTGAMLAELENVFLTEQPDWVLVYGDTNSTLAAALAAVKIHIPVAHLEAGLRSFNRRMPEEHNRVLTDHAADLLLAPTDVACAHLRNEGLAARTVLVGDVMTDVLYKVRDEVRSAALQPLSEVVDINERHYVATIHRAENTDDVDRLTWILASLRSLDAPVVLLAHPRLRQKANDLGQELGGGNLISHDPLSYPELVSTVMQSSGVITDSGGLQKEAFLLRVPCTTIRTETEWVETVELGWNILAQSQEDVIAGVMRPIPRETNEHPYGMGDTADRVITTLLDNRVVPSSS